MSAKLEDVVLELLEKDERTRNNDMQLTASVWWKMSPGSFVEVKGKWYVSLEDIIHSLAMQDTIKRIRARIQNIMGKFLPTDPLIRAKRAAAKKDKMSLESWQDTYLNN